MPNHSKQRRPTATPGPRDPEKLVKMRYMTNIGVSMSTMEKIFGVSRQHIHRYLHRHRNVVVKSDKSTIK